MKFRAVIPERNATIYFDLSDLIHPARKDLFSKRELLIPWLLAGNEPDRYIGLKDKNRKEIYEGDIIQTVSELMTNFGERPTGKYLTTLLSIEYDETNAKFKERDLITKYLKPLGLSQHSISQYSEVIGNIHEKVIDEAKE